MVVRVLVRDRARVAVGPQRVRRGGAAAHPRRVAGVVVRVLVRDGEVSGRRGTGEGRASRPEGSCGPERGASGEGRCPSGGGPARWEAGRRLRPRRSYGCQARRWTAGRWTRTGAARRRSGAARPGGAGGPRAGESSG